MLSTYNAYMTTTGLKSTTGGQAGIQFMGHDNGSALYGVQVYDSNFVAGSDFGGADPKVSMKLKGKGLVINYNICN